MTQKQLLTPQLFAAKNVSSTMAIGLYDENGSKPGDYRGFAELDLKDPDSSRTRVNALSNAKRALHFQVELLSDALGFKRWKERESSAAFSKRISFLEACGLITPRIIAKINRLRNAVEHEYVVPDREAVEDYADVVGLYLDASDKYVRSFPHLRELYTGPWKERTSYCLCTTRGTGVLRVYQCDGVTLLAALPKSRDQNPKQSPEEFMPIELEALLTIDIGIDTSPFFEWARVLLGTWSTA